MQFAVLTKAIDSPTMPPQVALALVRQTFQMIAANQEPRIKAAYPFAGERAGILIVEANSGDELQEVIGSLPFAGVVKIEAHAVGSVAAVLKTVEEAERRVAAMAQPTSVR